VLIVLGTTDILVDSGQAQALKAARPAAELVLIDGMNHVLKEVPANAPNPLASYGDPSLPLHPQLMPAIVGFLKTALQRP
jgi:hypothetical protein